MSCRSRSGSDEGGRMNMATTKTCHALLTWPNHSQEMTWLALMAPGFGFWLNLRNPCTHILQTRTTTSRRRQSRRHSTPRYCLCNSGLEWHNWGWVSLVITNQGTQINHLLSSLQFLKRGKRPDWFAARVYFVVRSEEAAFPRLHEDVKWTRRDNLREIYAL